MQNYEILIYALLAMGAIVIVVIVLRELLTWMLRVNELIANQQRIIELLEQLVNRRGDT